ncbi:MAG: class I SAM-dependent methyltransferase [Actinomycetota bacterium]
MTNSGPSGDGGDGAHRRPTETASTVESRLIDAVGHHRLPRSLADDTWIDQLARDAPGADDRALIDQVTTTARTIADQLRNEADTIAEVLAETVPGPSPARIGEYAQQHTLTVRVGGPGEAETAAEVLVALGYERRDRWTSGAAASFRRHAALLTLVRPDRAADGHTTSLRLRWADDPTRSTAERLVRPTAGDWDAVTLPTAMAWAYPVVRLGRLAAERIGVRRPHGAGLGPYLTTPTSLVGPLLDGVDLAPGDRLLDLGAGDGRIVVAAAQRGISAVGVEHDEDLVAAARRHIAAENVTAEMCHADARDLLDGRDGPDDTLATADAVLMFLPVDVGVELVPRLRAAMTPGSVIVLHEQHRLPDRCEPPDESRLVLAPDALTVAHTWYV